MEVNSKNTDINSKLMKNKYKYAYSKAQKKIYKLKTVFFNLRSIMNTGGYSVKTLEKMYKGIVKSGTVEENGFKLQFVSVFDKKDSNKLKYEIKYGINGVSIKVTNDELISGIHYIKFEDFDCNKIQEIVYNYYTYDRIETYRMFIKEDSTINVKFSFKNKENLNIFGNIWAFLREKKYIY